MQMKEQQRYVHLRLWSKSLRTKKANGSWWTDIRGFSRTSLGIQGVHTRCATGPAPHALCPLSPCFHCDTRLSAKCHPRGPSGDCCHVIGCAGLSGCHGAVGFSNKLVFIHLRRTPMLSAAGPLGDLSSVSEIRDRSDKSLMIAARKMGRFCSETSLDLEKKKRLTANRAVHVQCREHERLAEEHWLFWL